MPSVLPPPSQKATFVAHMFHRIARGYDRMNIIMTFGLDAWWRRVVVSEMRLAADARVLDLGSGTGPFIPLLRQAAPQGFVVGADFTVAMMQAGLHRLDNQACFVAADAQTLPFADNSFAAVSAGFVIRNVTDIDTTFREVWRVTQPGGVFAILEVAKPQFALVRWGHRLYFERIVPWIAERLGADAVAYRYLPESSRHFPDPPVLADMLRTAGWENVVHRRLAPGAVALHVAYKPHAAGGLDESTS